MSWRDRGDERILETIVERERVFDGIILHIDHLTAKLPNGKLAKREVAMHVGRERRAARGRRGLYCYLVRQYRAPIERVLLEIPAGKLDSAGRGPPAGRADANCTRRRA